MAEKLAPRRPAAPTSAATRPQRAAAGPLLPEWPVRLTYWIVAGLALLFYANTLGHDFAVDDKIVYYENKYVKQGLAGIPDLLTRDSFMGYFGEDKQLLEGGRYRPLSLVTFALEHQLWGLRAPLSHAVNVLLYALTAVLLLGLLRRMLPAPVALIATLLFMAHPVHTEAVANVKGREDLLGCLFLVGTAWYGLRYDRAQGSAALNLLGLAGCFLLGLLAKENSITWLALLPLTLHTFGHTDRTDWKRLAIATAPLLVLVAAWFLYRAQITGLTVETRNEVVLNEPYLLATAAQKFATIVHVLGRYLLLLLVPHPLAWDYSYAQIPYQNWSSPTVLFPLALYVTLIGVAVAGIRSRSPWTWCIGIYLAGVLLVSNLFINVGGFMADRFLYQPVLGVGWLHRQQALSPQVLRVGLGVVLALCFAKTVTRNLDWKDEHTVFLTDVKHVPNSCNANQAAGGACYRMAFDSLHPPDAQRRYELLQQSVQYYRRALQIYPDYGDASDDIRVVYAALNPLEDTRYPYWGRALALMPGQPVPEYNPAQAQKLLQQARSVYDPQQPDASMALLHQSLWHDPTQHNTWYNLGEIYFKQYNYAHTIRCFQKAIEFDPQSDVYWHDFGVALYNHKQYNEARQAFARVLELNPQHPSVRASMAALEKKAAQAGSN